MRQRKFKFKRGLVLYSKRWRRALLSLQISWSSQISKTLKKSGKTNQNNPKAVTSECRQNDARGMSGCLATPNKNCGLRILDEGDSSHSLIFTNGFVSLLGAFLIKILTLLWSCKQTAPRTLMIQHSCYQKDGLKSICLTSVTDCLVEGMRLTVEVPNIKCKFSLPIDKFVQM